MTRREKIVVWCADKFVLVVCRGFVLLAYLPLAGGALSVEAGKFIAALWSGFVWAWREAYAVYKPRDVLAAFHDKAVKAWHDAATGIENVA